jgi:putative FmdB family regulatory protein
MRHLKKSGFAGIRVADARRFFSAGQPEGCPALELLFPRLAGDSTRAAFVRSGSAFPCGAFGRMLNVCDSRVTIALGCAAALCSGIMRTFQIFLREETMPIYAYACSSCGLQRDVMQKMSDAPLSTCPQCGKQTFAKQLTAAGFQLKGAGYYATDFKNGVRQKTASKDEAACAPCASAGSCPMAESNA